MAKDNRPGLGGDEATAARVTEPVTDTKPRVLMLTDITTDIGGRGRDVRLVRSQARATGLDIPVLLNVDEVGVEGVLEELRSAREAGQPFDILVEDIWGRAGLLERAKEQQPNLYIILMTHCISGRTSDQPGDPVIDNIIIKDGLEPDFQARVAFGEALFQLRNREPAPAPAATG